VKSEEWRVKSEEIENMESFAFENLKAYNYARALVRRVYKLVANFPSSERNALCDQIHRAVISVPSNIAEGMSRKTKNAKLQYIEYSYGSLMEVLCQLQLANDLKYISDQELAEERIHIEETAKIISGLYSFINKTNNGDRESAC
jgi:four helix bundle protein